jgi:hypothetical protein
VEPIELAHGLGKKVVHLLVRSGGKDQDAIQSYTSYVIKDLGAITSVEDI